MFADERTSYIAVIITVSKKICIYCCIVRRILFWDFDLMSFYPRPRRLLLNGQHGRPPPSDAAATHDAYSRAANFDTNMIIILAALLCALICALGINSIARCFLRCANGLGGAGNEAPPRFGRKGLKKSALRRIPVAVYGSGEGVAFSECPICLGEFVDGEKIRVLPKCHHCYHVKCVDTWLGSHSSCPTCRRSLAEEEGGDVVVEVGGQQLGSASGVRGGGGGSEEMG